MARKTIEQHDRDIQRWGVKGLQMVRPAMEKVGQEVLAYARRSKLHMGSGSSAPGGVGVDYEGQVLHMRTGNLARSLTVRSKMRTKSVEVEVGTNLTNGGAPYPRYHEYGSPGGMIPERPWLRPSVAKKQSRLRTEIRKAWVMAYGR